MGKEAQVSSAERAAHTPERLAAGGGQGLGGEGGGEELHRGGGSVAEPPPVPHRRGSRARASRAVGRETSRAPPPTEVEAWGTR